MRICWECAQKALAFTVLVALAAHYIFKMKPIWTLALTAATLLLFLPYKKEENSAAS